MGFANFHGVNIPTMTNSSLNSVMSSYSDVTESVFGGGKRRAVARYTVVSL